MFEQRKRKTIQFDVIDFQSKMASSSSSSLFVGDSLNDFLIDILQKKKILVQTRWSFSFHIKKFPFEIETQTLQTTENSFKRL